MGNTADKPKHKPSTKVTLGEVLASLKDLVRNEFYDPSEDSSVTGNQDEASKAASQTAGSISGQPRKRGRPRKYPLTRVQDYSYSQEQGDLFGELPHTDEPEPERLPGASARESERPKPVAKRPTIKLETGQIRTNLKVVGNRQPATDTGQTPSNERKPARIDMAKNTNHAEQAPEDPVSLNWADDIPVLTDIVEDLLSATEEPATEPRPKTPAPEARAIAVKVAAKLNIEMRETGGEQLDIKTIMRLQSLLKEALEPKD